MTVSWISYPPPPGPTPLPTLWSWQTESVMRTTLPWIMYRRLQCSHSTAGALLAETDKTIFCLWQNSEMYQTAAKQNAGDDWLRCTPTTSSLWRGGVFVWVLPVCFSSKSKKASCNFGRCHLRFSEGIPSWIHGCFICWCNIHILPWNQGLNLVDDIIVMLVMFVKLFKVCNDNPEIQNWSDNIGYMLMLLRIFILFYTLWLFCNRKNICFKWCSCID